MPVTYDRQTADERRKERKKKRMYGNPNGSNSPDGRDVYKSPVDEAIREGWTKEQYEQAVYDSEEFNREFPGYFRPDGSTPFGSGADYKNAYDQYAHIAAQYGQSISKDTFASMVQGSVDAGEFSERLRVVDRIKTLEKEMPGTVAKYANATKGLGGDGSLNELMRMATGKALPDLYDAYEAAQLRAGGLNIGDKAMGDLTKAIGDGEGALDLGQTIQDILALHPDIGPELKAEGISDADLVKLKAGGIDPSGKLAQRIREKVAQRRAFGQSAVRKQVGASATGSAITRGQETGEGSI